MTSISVCMATFNGAPFVVAQIESVIRQLNEADELVVVDDCSVDSTRELLLSRYAELRNVKLVFHERNRGVNQAMITAIAESNGDVVLFCDQDDIWYPGRVEAMRRVFNNRSDVGLVSSNADISFEGEILCQTFDLVRPSTSFFRVFCKNCFIGCTLGVRRNLIPRKLKLPPLNYYDHCFGLLILMHSKAAFINETHALYRRHTHTLTNIFTRKNIFSVAGSRLCLAIWLVWCRGIYGKG